MHAQRQLCCRSWSMAFTQHQRIAAPLLCTVITMDLENVEVSCRCLPAAFQHGAEYRCLIFQTHGPQKMAPSVVPEEAFQQKGICSCTEDRLLGRNSQSVLCAFDASRELRASCLAPSFLSFWNDLLERLREMLSALCKHSSLRQL